MSGIEVGDRDGSEQRYPSRAKVPKSKSGIEIDADIKDGELLSTEPSDSCTALSLYRTITKFLVS